MNFIHISDLHLHMHINDNRQANDLLKIIKDNYGEHKLIVTGDITDDGHPIQFENAFNALEPFKGNIFIVPGNHDFGAAGKFYNRERTLRFDKMLSTPLQQGGAFTGDNIPFVYVVQEGDYWAVLIALDTNLETYTPFDCACGAIGDEQLSTLDTILSDPSIQGAIKLLFFHRYPFVRNNPFMELTDARKLMRTIYSRVDVFMFGHKHVYEQWQNMNGIPFILASDNSPGKDWAHEISIKGTKVTVKNISIKIKNKKKTITKKNP